MSIYIRTSPFERQDALRHLIAMSGCSAAVKVGVANARPGEPGYHARNDSNRDGIACNETGRGIAASGQGMATNGQGIVFVNAPESPAPVRSAGGAKFIKP